MDEARRLLTVAGFRLRDDGRLLDRDGNRVKLTIVTTTGSNERQRAGAFIQEDLSELGIDVTLTPLEGGDLLARVTGSYDYEVFLLGITQTDPDPSAEMALWLSRAPLHLWHPSQPEPATAWEARIDELMEAQMAALDLEQRKAMLRQAEDARRGCRNRLAAIVVALRLLCGPAPGSSRCSRAFKVPQLRL